MTSTAVSRLFRVSAIWLLCLSTWTIVIKYVDPLLWAEAERIAGRATAAPILWDFWPLAHVSLAAWLFAPRRGAWMFALIVSAAEIAVVSIRLAAFLGDPIWSFQQLSWLFNKIFVFATFLAILPILLRSDVRTFFRRAEGSGWKSIEEVVAQP